LIQAEELGAVKGDRILYSGITLTVRAGDILVLKGSNGSGKTTLLRQLAGLSEPQAGQISRKAKHHWIGHAHALKAHETPRRHLKHWASVWGGTRDLSSILNAWDLEQPADLPSRHLSAGQKRRTALARLKLDERRIWLLDEPFNALDKDGRFKLSQDIREHARAGGAVIAALHGVSPVNANAELHL